MDDSMDALERLLDERVSAASGSQMLGWATSGVVRAFRLRIAEATEQVRLYERSRPASGESAEVRAAGKPLGRNARTRVSRAVNQFFHDLIDAGTAMNEQWSDLPDEFAGVALPIEQRLILGRLLLGEEKLDEIAARLTSNVETPTEMQYASALLAEGIRAQGSPLALDSILVIGYSAVEDLMLSLFRLQAMTDDVDDDQSPESIIRGLSDTADGAAKGGPKAWRKHVRAEVGFDIAELVGDWDALLELHLRRNKVVHAGGRVDERYLGGLPKSGAAPEPGEQLVTTPEYVDLALSMLLAVGAGLGVLWPKLMLPNEVQTLDHPIELVVALLDRSAWADAECLAQTLGSHVASETDRTVLLVNEWMAIRERTGSVAAVRDAVLAFLPPDDDPMWRLAAAALLEDNAEVRALLTEQRDSGADLAKYRGWPLMRKVVSSDSAVDFLLQGREPRPRRRS